MDPHTWMGRNPTEMTLLTITGSKSASDTNTMLITTRSVCFAVKRLILFHSSVRETSYSRLVCFINPS